MCTFSTSDRLAHLQRAETQFVQELHACGGVRRWGEKLLGLSDELSSYLTQIKFVWQQGDE